MVPVRTVDIDTLFLLQFAIDWLWFWAAGRLGCVPVSWQRLTAAAGLAAAMGVWGEFPSGAVLHLWPAKLAVTAACALLAVGATAPARAFPRQFLSTLVVGIAMAGGGLLLTPEQPGAGFLVEMGDGILVGYGGAPRGSGMILAGSALALAGSGLLLKSAVAWRRLSSGLRQVEVTVGGASINLTALVDTGNCLLEPLSSRVVLVAELGAMAPALPAIIVGVARRPAAAEALASLPPEWARRCRLVPYHAVGNAGGLLLAIATDAVRLDAGDPSAGHGAIEPAPYVGLAPEPLDPTGAFQALLPGDYCVRGR